MERMRPAEVMPKALEDHKKFFGLFGALVSNYNDPSIQDFGKMFEKVLNGRETLFIDKLPSIPVSSDQSKRQYLLCTNQQDPASGNFFGFRFVIDENAARRTYGQHQREIPTGEPDPTFILEFVRVTPDLDVIPSGLPIVQYVRTTLRLSGRTGRNRREYSDEWFVIGDTRLPIQESTIPQTDIYQLAFQLEALANESWVPEHLPGAGLFKAVLEERRVLEGAADDDLLRTFLGEPLLLGSDMGKVVTNGIPVAIVRRLVRHMDGDLSKADSTSSDARGVLCKRLRRLVDNL